MDQFSKPRSHKWKRPKIETLYDKKGNFVGHRVRKAANGSRPSRRFKTWEEAEAYIEELEAARFRVVKKIAVNKGLHLKALMEHWRPHKTARTSDSTFRTFEIAFKAHWRAVVGDKTLGEITEQEFDAVMSKTFDRSPSRRSQIARVILELNRYAKRVLKYPPENLLQFEIEIKEIRSEATQPAEKIVFIRSDRIEKYLKDFRSARHRQTWLVLLNELLIGTGMRIGEATCLQWDQFDEQNCILRIDRHIASVRDERTGIYSYQIKPGTKAGRKITREIPLSEDTMAVLRALKERWHRIRKEAKIKGNNFIFITDHPRRSKRPYVSYCTMRNSLSYTMKKIFSKEMTPHKLRHTFATDFIVVVGEENRNAPKMVQLILGHKSSVMTDKYVHLTDDDATKGMKIYGGRKRRSTIGD